MGVGRQAWEVTSLEFRWHPSTPTLVFVVQLHSIHKILDTLQLLIPWKIILIRTKTDLTAHHQTVPQMARSAFAVMDGLNRDAQVFTEE